METIGNPMGDIPDLETIADLAHEHGLPLIVDNTFATPYLCRPIEHGGDIVVHSATKFIGGHGTSIGGVIVDSGKFNWRESGRFRGLTEPDPSYHGVVYTEALGDLAYILKARVQLLRDIRASLSPFNAWLFLRELETLHLRMARHSEKALAVAQFLEQHPVVESVSYPGLASHPHHSRALRFLPKGQGAILPFEVRGGVEAGRKVIQSVRLFSHLPRQELDHGTRDSRVPENAPALPANLRPSNTPPDPQRHTPFCRLRGEGQSGFVRREKRNSPRDRRQGRCQATPDTMPLPLERPVQNGGSRPRRIQRRWQPQFVMSPPARGSIRSCSCDDPLPPFPQHAHSNGIVVDLDPFDAPTLSQTPFQLHP